MEDPSSQDLLLQFVLLVVLTFLNAFSQQQRWLWFRLVAHALNKRLKRVIKAISVC